MQDLGRIALWGSAGVAALAIAVFAATTDTGLERIRRAAAEVHQALRTTDAKPAAPLDDREARKLAETVRKLAADRERLLARIATLEHSLNDITGSISRAEKPAPRSEPATPMRPATAQKPPEPPATTTAAEAPTASPPTASPPDEDITSSINPQVAVPMPRPAPAPSEVQTAAQHAPATNAASRTKYGIQIGRADSMENLSALWEKAVQRYPAQLQGMRPVAHLMERPSPRGGTELRLVAGPIASAALAARHCASLAAAGASCQVVSFDGRRIAGR